MKKLLLVCLVAINTNTYASEHEQYWNAWHQNRNQIEQCSSISKVTLFMQDAISNLGSAERTEANAEVIESVILNNPACFLSALSALSQEQCKTFVRFFIQAPLFHDASQIENALKSVKPSSTSCYVS